jgi:hypothetical protein
MRRVTEFERSWSPMTNPPTEPNAERRRTARKRGAYSVWAAFGVGMPIRECTLWDESDGGAKLSPKTAREFGLAEIPNDFFVYMSPDADFRSRRRCRVAWRSDTCIGVEFLPAAPKTAGVSSSSAPKSGVA